uniref:hypothetical protein n=1 Tax=Aeromonas sp. Ne-1 TaxID=1675689 RepID=UPI00156649D2|nr:hypothetical protein [Aeromonas sp. Ne-1]
MKNTTTPNQETIITNLVSELGEAFSFLDDSLSFMETLSDFEDEQGEKRRLDLETYIEKGREKLETIKNSLLEEDVVFEVAEENMGEFESLNFYIDHESLSFVGYEFEGKEIYLEEIGGEQSLFRMDIDKETGEISVHSAYSEDYDLMEEVTYCFDTEKLKNDIYEYMKNHEVDNHGATFIRYIQLIDKGYDSESAVVVASNDC